MKQVKKKSLIIVICIVALTHLLLPLFANAETQRTNHLFIVFGLFWSAATLLVLSVAFKHLGLRNFSFQGLIQNNVNLGFSDMTLVKIAILLYFAGISFVVIGLWIIETV